MEQTVTEISIDKLSPYPDHPFSPCDENSLAGLVESIKENGLLHPIIVCRNVIVSGHNRVNAFKKLGLHTIPAIVKDGLTKEEADIIVVESNLRQREKLLHSEKAKAYKMRNDALKINKSTAALPSNIMASGVLSQLETGQNFGQIISNEFDACRADVYRYIRLNNLNQCLLDLIDDETIPFRAGVELTYLDYETQSLVHDFFFVRKMATKKLDIKTAMWLRDVAKRKKIDEKTLKANFIAKKRIKAPVIKPVRLAKNKLGDLLDHVAEESKVDYVLNAIRHYIKSKEEGAGNEHGRGNKN